jgi:hypothetical protein
MSQEFSEAFPDTMGDFEDVLAYLKPGPDEHVVASFPVIFPDDTTPRLASYPNQGQIRGIIFAIVPGAKDHAEAMRTFLDELIASRSAPAIEGGSSASAAP